MSDYPQSPQQKSKRAYSSRIRGVFYWSLVREFASMGGLVFAILLAIVVLTQLIRFLGDAASGALAIDGVLALLGFSALNYLPVLLSISLFLSVLLSLTRSYRDSEMVVWFSAGIGLTRWIRPVLGYALPVISVIALMSLVLSPWALTKAGEFQNRLDSRDDVTAATPGMFRESKQADRVFFLEDVDTEKKRVGNIFVQSVQNGKEGAIVAKEGFQETAPNGDRFLVLLNGTRYEGVPGQADFRIAEFERYSIRIDAAEVKPSQPVVKAYPTSYLLQNPNSWNMAELLWRLGLPISALILAVMAIPLSFVNPRSGRSLNLIMAMVLFMLYNNMISVTQSWVGNEKIRFTEGVWGLHMIMFVLLIILFYKRVALRFWRWKR
jgi:lipopolysaccharide export system permease protein